MGVFLKHLVFVILISTSVLSGCDFVKGLFGKSAEQQAQDVQTEQTAPSVPTTEEQEAMTAEQEAQLKKFEEAPKDSIWPPSKAIVGCPGGGLAKVISGDCKGEWTIRTNSYPTACLYTWGPTVSCPSGNTPATRASACFGYIAKPIGPEDKINAPEDCEKKHGKSPSSPTFEIQCCPAAK